MKADIQHLFPSLFIKQQADPPLFFDTLRTLDGNHRLKRLYHGPPIILLHPGSQSHQFRLDRHAVLGNSGNRLDL